MVLDGRSVIDKRMVTFDDSPWPTEEQIQPNGIDLRVKDVYEVVGRVNLPREGKMDASELQVNKLEPKAGWYDLRMNAGHFVVDFYEYVTVPAEWCGIIIPRSSMVRTGVEVLSGLWDTGFTGRLGASIRLRNPLRVQLGARIAQIVFWKSQFKGNYYTGTYQGKSQTEFK